MNSAQNYIATGTNTAENVYIVTYLFGLCRIFNLDTFDVDALHKQVSMLERIHWHCPLPQLLMAEEGPRTITLIKLQES